ALSPHPCPSRRSSDLAGPLGIGAYAWQGSGIPGRLAAHQRKGPPCAATRGVRHHGGLTRQRFHPNWWESYAALWEDVLADSEDRSEEHTSELQSRENL